MARSSRLAMLFALVCAGAGAVSWALLRSTRERAEPVAATPAEAKAEDAYAPRSSSALERAEPAESDEPEPPAARVAPQSRTSAAAEQAELADAIWIEGRVRFPAGTPSDERAEVVAFGRAFETLRHHRAEVARDGSFKVAFHSKTKTAKLLLEARYAYLESAFKVDLRKPPADLVLEPRLGALVEGVLLPPAALRPDDPAPAAVQVQIWSDGGFSASEDAEAGERGFAFELGGVPAGQAYTFSALPKTWSRLTQRLDMLEAGTRLALELQLKPGVRVSGRVIDDAGRALEKASVLAMTSGRDAFHGSTSPAEATSDAAGAFDLRGVAPGAIEVTARLTGHVPARVQVGELADGEARVDVEVVLARGHSVAGRVVWPDGRPAAGASVRVEDSLDRTWGGQVFFGGEGPVTRTAADGAFEITGLGSGPYQVTASAAAEAAGEADGKRAKDERCVAQANGVPTDAAELVLVLGAGGRVRGRVVDERGAPLDDFTVALRRASKDRWEVERTQSFRDAGGAFELGGLGPGDWIVTADAKEHVDSGEVRVTLPRDEEPIELVVITGARVAGVVLQPDGQPARGARVSAWPAGEPSYSGQDVQVPTDEDGRFALVGVAPGRVGIEVEKAGYAGVDALELELRPGERRDGFVLALLRGASIEGEIVAQDATRRADQQLQLAPSESSRSWRWSGSWKTATSDSEGRFGFDHVLPGTYRVERQMGHMGSGGDSVEVTVADGQTVRVVLGRPKEGAIRVFGTVSRAGAGIAHANVMAWRHGAPSSARTDAAGSYELFVDGPGQYWFSASEQNAGSSGSGRQQEIVEGAEQRVDFDLSSGRIRGRVVDPDGGGIAGAWVWASAPAGHGQAESGVDGVFEIEGLPAGMLRLQAQEASAIPRYAPAVTQVALAEGATLAGIELRLAEAGAIEGRVMTAAGEPLIGASVIVVTPGSQRPGATTDATGRFKAGGLGAGPCSIWARKGLLVSETRTVDVTAESTVEVELTASSGTLVQVVIENPDAWFGPALTDANGVAHSWSDRNDPELRAVGGELPKGAQRIGPLPPGEYTLAVGQRNGGQTVRQSVTLKGEPFREIEVKVE